MPDWRIWLRNDAALAAHAEQLVRHGGAQGIRDPGALESALARPQNLAVYSDPDVSALAAAYAFGIARNHPFVDGNKRTAAVVSASFLRLNGWRLTTSEADIVVAFLSLAGGELSEEELADWFRQRLSKL